MVEHNLIFSIGMLNAWQIKKASNITKYIQICNMRKYKNKSLFREDLKQAEWRTIFDTYIDDPLGMASIFQDIFTTDQKKVAALF